MNTTPSRPRGIYLLPNLLTVCALLSGFFAIISAFKGQYEVAAISIFIAAIMDALDGRIARLTNTMTNFGAEFDSMSDMVSFAIAPAVLAYAWGLTNLGKIGWLVAFVYTAAVALRLARFNTQASTTTGKKHFQGLPCPSAAIIVASSIWLYTDYDLHNPLILWLLVVTMLAVALLMVSNVRYLSFKDIELKKHVRFVIILFAALVIALISIDPEKILLTLFASYAISGPIATIWGLHQKRLLRKQGATKTNIQQP